MAPNAAALEWRDLAHQIVFCRFWNNVYTEKVQSVGALIVLDDQEVSVYLVSLRYGTSA